jgi:hypothetical protein
MALPPSSGATHDKDTDVCSFAVTARLDGAAGAAAGIADTKLVKPNRPGIACGVDESVVVPFPNWP